MEFGVVEFTKIGAYVVIFAFFWRMIAIYLATAEDGSRKAEIGKAMAFLF